MSTRMWVTRLAVAAVITAAIMFGAVAWASSNQPAPKPKTIQKVVEVTPDGCARFAEEADAFVSVTEDFLSVQNEALDALLTYDAKTLTKAVDKMQRLQKRYDAVMERYSDTRAGCLT